MKRFVLALTLSLVLSAAAAAEFRGHAWGESMERVLQANGAPADKDENVLAYKDEVGGVDATVFFMFVDGRLANGIYQFEEEYMNKNSHIKDYQKVNDLLKKKYGKPQMEETTWLDSLYKGKREEYGTAISIGHLKLYSTWKTEKTEITHALMGENFDIQHGLLYADISATEDIEAKKEQDNLDKL